MQKLTLKAALLGSALSAVAFSCGAAWADAAETTSAPAGDIVVTGVRQKSTLNEKKTATGVVDGISAAEIQRVPNATVAEALVHITGVSVTPNNDNERGRNFAQAPAIRGLDSKYNNVMIDGLPVASANFIGTGVSSRTTALDALPASMVSQIQVYKTYSPDRDPEAIGGGIELTTRSAFDNGGAPVLQLIGKAGYNSLNSEPYPQSPVNYNADLAFSRVFGDHSQFGLVISAVYERTADDTYDNATTDNTYYNFYTPAGVQVSNPALGNGYSVPQQSKAWIIEEVNKKADLTGKLEWRPTKAFSAFVELGYYYDANDATRNENILTPGGVLTNQTATSGSFSKGDVEVGGQYSPLHRTNYDILTGAKYQLTDQDLITLRASDSASKWRQPELMVKYINQTTSSPVTNTAPLPVAGNAFNYQVYNNYSIFNINPAFFDNANNYYGDYWRYRNRDIGTDNAAFKLDYSHNAEADSTGFGFKAGVDVAQTRNELHFETPDYEPNAPGTLTLAGAQGFSSFKIPNYSNLPFMLIDINKAFAQLNNNPSLFHLTNTNSAQANNFELREDTTDGYGMFVYNTANLHGMVGLRTDSAHVDVTGNQQLPTPAGVVNPGLASTPYPAYAPIEIKSKYFHPLPAASISYLPVSSLQLRAAYSQTVGRPDYSDYSPSSGVTVDTVNNLATITQGNLNLKPRLSTNYDLGGEWYFAPNSMLSVATFYKKIQNEIFSLTTNGTTPYVYNGVAYPTIMTEPVNAAASNVKGVEFELVHSNFNDVSPWLKGLGADFNYTLLSGKATLPYTLNGVVVNGVKTNGVLFSRNIHGLINQPNFVGNLILTYDNGPFFAAVADNFKGRAIRSLVANAAWQDVYWSPHNQVDLKLGYRVTPELEFNAAVQNLTNETTKSVTGPSKELLKDNSYVGQTIWFSVVYRPKL